MSALAGLQGFHPGAHTSKVWLLDDADLDQGGAVSFELKFLPQQSLRAPKHTLIHLEVLGRSQNAIPMIAFSVVEYLDPLGVLLGYKYKSSTVPYAFQNLRMLLLEGTM